MTSLALVPKEPQPLRVAEFFAGIGLVRAGLEKAGFGVVWANDYEPAKKEMYEGNFGTERHEFVLGDVADIKGEDMPRSISLAWASFPCTDLSLAGDRRGLAGKQSGTFWEFARIIQELEDDKPGIIALENVHGLATSHGGDDLAALVKALNNLGYSVDVLTLDGRRFVPQSRPRIFIVGALEVPEETTERVSDLRPSWLQGVFADHTLRTHRAALPAPPEMRVDGLNDYVEKMPITDERWWDAERTDRFLSSLSSIQRTRLEVMKDGPSSTFRTAYRRTRQGVPVWEIRADAISGCLRTARGGSSKQAVVMAGLGQVRVRWMTSIEYARLMGAGDYNLNGLRENQILFGFGDAVCVPAVAWIAQHYLMPLATGALRPSAKLTTVSA